ncbi:AGE family epimerase/isomerase [Vibrio sp. CAU 1672]|uniref:AGE family epimerase/isomerase n=1 Tax=Vibrio sp. CAU 1672 TaxID=3032594 RepID=UPI0031F36885
MLTGLGLMTVNASAQEEINYQAMLPTGEAWIQHATQGLAPYWMAESAQGLPVGNFPTFRCDNGEVLDVRHPCPELNDHGWIRAEFGRDYTRMKSRQTYAYGVLYHLTGDPDALKLAKAGVDYLLTELRDSKNGGFISYRQNGKPGLNWQQRTSQDQAYALVGLAFYYYLTRDPRVEQALIEQQKFIFDHYRSQTNDQLLWVLADSENEKTAQRELVAQLDQINAYLLLVMPLLPKQAQEKWQADLEWLTRNMLAKYHNPSESRFYGAIHHPAMMSINAKHNDYGHTIKAYWMTYLVGQALHNEEWMTLAYNGMKTTLSNAAFDYPKSELKPTLPPAEYNAISSEYIYSWQDKPFSRWASSWQWAELDQALMTIAMHEGDRLAPDLTRQLFFTTSTFQQYWVDEQFGGVGLMPKSVKQFHWGNGYHQFEHALVGYISAQTWYKQPVELYYAFAAEQEYPVQPYYFKGQLISHEQMAQPLGIPGLVAVKARFDITAN